jgi:alpha-D-xyloside xylohydrolase
MGPYLLFAAEKCSDPLEVRIYPGAAASFTLYEDDGTTMHYLRRNESSTIAMEWDDRARTLKIAAREGQFPGMLHNRTLHVVLVSRGFGVGMEPTGNPTQVLAYTGTSLSVKL